VLAPRFGIRRELEERMQNRVTEHIRSNVVGYLALFFALTGGVAWATHPGGANTISSTDIINGEVRNADLGADAVASGKIDDRQVKNADLSIGASSSNTIADGGIQGVDVKNGTLTGAQIDESSVNGGGDLSGPLSDLEIGPGRIGRAELGISGSELGCCVFSDFEYSVPANGCHTKTLGLSGAKLGDIFIGFPESSDLGTGVYLRPTVVAHPGEIIFEICNTTGSPVTIPFGTFFKMRLID
jgi:hypothetical protein